ncbi:hypothetical protein GQ53DRAFT_655570 [Thozetella sp. PMI_491]|nr:hypothetical protein GQ53DRAFT_655570 [Thozetella sp. PMI_491]
MCIVLLTTSHPDYALIVIDNRDEFILRPTSRPHWWKPHNDVPNGAPAQGVDILSSRDLQRKEQGTWLGITRQGNFAVLTNYREGGNDHPSVSGTRSRGAMVTAWLAADPEEPTTKFVSRMLEEGATKGVGGFSLICGKLRRRRTGGGEGENGASAAQTLAPMAIVSNRHETADAVPWICGERGEVHGLSNMVYVHPDEAASGTELWPKVADGTTSLKKAVDDAIRDSKSEDALVEALYQILDQDKLPTHPNMKFEDYIDVLKESIFIPAIGDDKHKKEMEAAVRDGFKGKLGAAAETIKSAERPDEQSQGFMTGLYGTQRQTIILVDWDGNVTYKERALWDEDGNPVARGEGDMSFTYKIEGWDSE